VLDPGRVKHNCKLVFSSLTVLRGLLNERRLLFKLKSYWSLVLDECVDMALEIVSDVINSSGFPEVDVATARSLQRYRTQELKRAKPA
jgi:hypothetical protein